MKITHNKIGQNLNLTDSSRADKSKSSSKVDSAQSSKSSAASLLDSTFSGAGAKVDLSQRAQDIQLAKDVASSTPEIDQAKVDKFQKLIDEGKYKIDSKAIADRLVDEELMSTKN